MDAERVPVIIGCGETIDRPGDCPGNEAPPREPAQLMADALRLADADAGGGWLDRLGSLDVVNSVSWRYADLPGRVARLLGRRPARLSYGAVGGETPVRFLHEAALRIAGDGGGVAAVCGGEAQAAVTAARRAGTVLRWPEEDPGWAVTRSGDLSHPLAKALGVAQPVTVYPFYENACQAAWGQTPEEGREESAALWAAMSEVAAGNPSAWLRRPHAAADIALASPANRPVAWPYTKLMVANPGVNQGAAVLLTSLAQARTAGIPEHKLAFPGLGAAAEEPSDYLQRPRFDQSPAMDAVLAGVRDRFGRFDHLELYSCFPCVPKMAARTLGLDPGTAVTVTGGLTFFGAPLNDYMLHAACAMVRRLRGTPGIGLLYGQGGFVSRHHALVLAGEQGGAGQGTLPSTQADADASRGPGPDIVEAACGEARVETHTVLYDRHGAPVQGMVMLRLPSGARTLARVPQEDAASLALLTGWSKSPIGRTGRLRSGTGGLSEWNVT
jgi:acetyl-CoA C-acetyltransferase